ncbi:DUF2867 domain-containing protein [Desulfovibrio sp. JC022]|uniref:DUF2867 domain-containing protein n=1 Tax=Desulfovibrio sp. JC022 TaxID=2593642 RepID=UPI0013D2A93C|nr:DUF2867 domain-containing protein [Desulfovibrio sp. JC022]NDV21861.1 DUF2867 domain-containing protein [Desulfovibrio sp. JC022]
MSESASILNSIPQIHKLSVDADHIYSKDFVSHRAMDDFLIRLMSYKPGWLTFLYKVRGVLAKIMGLKHDEFMDHGLEVSDYDFNRGGQVDFFSSVDFEAETFWIGEAEDKHLIGYIGVVSEPAENSSHHYHVFTIVRYKHWTGPVYFNLIRPFSHLVVYFMGKYAAE